MKKWRQAPRVGVILPVVRIGRRSQSPFFHKRGASCHRETRVGEALPGPSRPENNASLQTMHCVIGARSMEVVSCQTRCWLSVVGSQLGMKSPCRWVLQARKRGENAKIRRPHCTPYIALRRSRSPRWGSWPAKAKTEESNSAIPLHFIRCTTDGDITWTAGLPRQSEGVTCKNDEVALHAMHCVADRAITWTFESNGEIRRKAGRTSLAWDAI